MFGYVMPSWKALNDAQQQRYRSVYCGICRAIGTRCSQTARLGLSYDMAFLALLHMSLYEPEETAGRSICLLHPASKRPWTDNGFVHYAADLNVLLAYYNLMDDWLDERKYSARALATRMEKTLPPIRQRYVRQDQAIEASLRELSRLEQENCPNPDVPAGVFGRLMGALFVYQEDLWADTLRQMGFHLGRFIYLLDAMEDCRKDARKGRYNPFLAMGQTDPDVWEQYLLMAMGSCTQFYEKLPLVQDKALLDNILYSGVWQRKRFPQEGNNHGK